MSDEFDPKVSASGEPGKVRVRYETTECTYASQFLVNASADEIIVSFSAGYIQDPGTAGSILPIQSRIALSPSGAKRLIDTLNRALESRAQEAPQGGAPTTASPVEGPSVGQASLPKLT